MNRYQLLFPYYIWPEQLLKDILPDQVCIFYCWCDCSSPDVVRIFTIIPNVFNSFPVHCQDTRLSVRKESLRTFISNCSNRAACYTTLFYFCCCDNTRFIMLAIDTSIYGVP